LPPRPKIGAVVLAAGRSQRLGVPKQLLLYEGEPLLRRAVLAVRDSGAAPVVVVLGAEADRIAPVLGDIRVVRTITNYNWTTGLASSLAVGIKALLEAGDSDGVLVTLADQPLVDAASLGKLLDAFSDEHRIVASAYNGIIGVPAIFAQEHLTELMALTGDAGAGSWLRSRADTVTSIPLSAAATDVDTPSEAAELT